VGGHIELGERAGLGCDVAPIWDVGDSSGEAALGEVWIVGATH